MAKINKDKEESLSLDILYQELNYDSSTGHFSWKVSRPGVKKGKRAGSIKADGYRKIRINKQEFLEHRLAWFYTFNTWPTDILDHIDGNKTNNSISNLRESNTRVNGFNRPDNSKFGHNIYSSGKNYYIQIQFQGSTYRYGIFNIEKAIEYRNWLLEYIDIFNKIPKDNKELIKILKVYME